jgi:hypothetical protein
MRANNGMELSSYLEGGGRRLCQAYPAFQEWAVRQMKTALEMGFGTVFIDQPFAEDYCFAENHGHPVGAPTHAGACSWTAQVCKSIRRRNPDAWLMGEVPDIEQKDRQNIYPSACFTGEGMVVVYSTHFADPNGSFAGSSHELVDCGGKCCILAYPAKEC